MSTDSGDAKLVGDIVGEAKRLLDAANAEADQLDLLDPVSPDDIAAARDELGPGAGRLAVLSRAREAKRGRPPGSRNRRTDDFARYILSFGPDPAVTMMQIQATDPEVLVENSCRRVTKIKKGVKDRPDEVVTFEEYTLTYEAAQSLRIRCAEALIPYIHSKMPIAIDQRIRADFTLIEEIVEARRDDLDDGDFEVLSDVLGDGA